MADNKPPYERMTPSQFVAEATQKVPETQRDEAKRLQESQKSLEKPWEPQRERYEVAHWLAKGLLLTFSIMITLSGVLIIAILIIKATNANISDEDINLAIGFVKDLLPFVATPLGVAMGFYFREGPD